MGQVLHGGTGTTEAVRRAIQAGEESVRALARRYGRSRKGSAARSGARKLAARPEAAPDAHELREALLAGHRARNAVALHEVAPRKRHRAMQETATPRRRRPTC